MAENNTDLKFFTNDENDRLLDRFEKTLACAQFFDVLVGYFRTSGFHRLSRVLEKVEKIRILVGLNVDSRTYEIYETGTAQQKLDFESHKKARQIFSGAVQGEMEKSEDSSDVQDSVDQFIEFIKTRKIEMRAYPSRDIHAKVYITRYGPPVSAVSFGSVITGSSNFSESGFSAQREFNVELKDSADVRFALDKFEALWEESVDLSKEYVETIENKTWLNDSITPYELYLKLIYEYLEEDINLAEDFEPYLPDGFMNLKYQSQAAIQAKKILERYNGIFLADVVGLGKTFITALLLQQLQGKFLIICPPVLRDYWKDSLFDFGVRSCEVESLGKLDKILKKGVERYTHIVIDESHRFRNEATQSFAELLEICRGKKVILVTATPLNNKIEDIFSQLKLFQLPRQSTIPGVPNLEDFFARLRGKLAEYDKADPEYKTALKETANAIRDKVLKFVMVRRTRADVIKYFRNDTENQGLTFPELQEPRRLIYQFTGETEKIFLRTIELLKDFRYTRYIPLLYIADGQLSEFELQQQRNVGGFMKGVLVKRLESSFYAFRKSISRFMGSYEKFIDMYNQGMVYVGGKTKIFDLLENDDFEAIEKLIAEDKVSRYPSKNFKKDFLSDLNRDLEILREIAKLWARVQDDPKLEIFIRNLKTDKLLKKDRLIIFTESRETGDYLYENLHRVFPGKVLFYSSKGGRHTDELTTATHHVARDMIIDNYDPASKEQNGDLQILIATDILAEGINLHRAGTVINYDMPWNPTRVLQRVGRVNRIGTKHQNVFIFNFFPTTHSDEHLGLESNVISKIQLFHNILGEDAKYLSDGEEIGSQELFDKLNNKKNYTGEDEEEDSELKYLELIRDIRDNRPELFEKIKRLPKKARSGLKKEGIENNQLVTFFRQGLLKKFYLNGGEKVDEITFFDAVDKLQCAPETKREKIPSDYFSRLADNKHKLEMDLTAGDEPDARRGGRSNATYVLHRLKAREFVGFKQFTGSDEEYIEEVVKMLEQGTLAKKTAQRIKKELEREEHPLKILCILRKHIKNTSSLEADGAAAALKREVILSCYLVK